MSEELKPCPFCGEQPKHSIWSVHDYHNIECEMCGLEMDFRKSWEEALRDWNRRTPPAEGRELPSNCRYRQQAEGKSYPRSGCDSCGNGGIAGCPYMRDTAPAEQPSEAAQERCILCANGNDLPEGEYCRGCGRENHLRPLGAAVMKARGINLPPKTKLEFSEQPITAQEAIKPGAALMHIGFLRSVIRCGDPYTQHVKSVMDDLKSYIEQTAQDREDAYKRGYKEGSEAEKVLSGKSKTSALLEASAELLEAAEYFSERMEQGVVYAARYIETKARQQGKE